MISAETTLRLVYSVHYPEHSFVAVYFFTTKPFVGSCTEIRRDAANMKI
jgi:hypothetical protein